MFYGPPCIIDKYILILHNNNVRERGAVNLVLKVPNCRARRGCVSPSNRHIPAPRTETAKYIIIYMCVCAESATDKL